MFDRMNARIIAIAVLLVSAHVVNGQDQAAPGRETVMYDPLFWKDQLSLKHSQERKIQEINREFYDGLRQLRGVSHSKTELQSQLDLGLQERSMKIWATLHNKQKRKLEKILEENSLQGP